MCDIVYAHVYVCRRKLHRPIGTLSLLHLTPFNSEAFLSVFFNHLKLQMMENITSSQLCG